MKVNLNNIMIPIRENQEKKIKEAIKKTGLKENLVLGYKINKRSIDSRSRNNIKFLYNIEISLRERIDITRYKGISKVKEMETKKRIPKKIEGEVVVVGAGPAGLFAALKLCEYGYTPLIIERGEMVEDRDKTIERFNNLGILNEESNIQYGEGGAGTYSDGKLNTRVKSEYIQSVFKTLVENGAPEQIMWDYKPHIGTDILKKVVVNIRKKIIENGGTFLFNTMVEDFLIVDNKVKGILIKGKDGKREIATTNLFLGTGHSARETYRTLNKKGVFMENKPFAMGVRIEHRREVIDTMQYGNYAGNKELGAATYAITNNDKKEGRGTFSFCMCPGGVVVNAASSQKTNLVNGMSYSQRDGEFSNSAIAVGIKGNEFGDELFSGMEFQEKLERMAYDKIGKHGGMGQRALDYLKNKKSKSLPMSSYPQELVSSDLNELFPEVINRNLKNAFEKWQKNLRGFVTNDALLIGPETRTSAPVKITRNENGESLNTKGLYPIGEGAGYAGGITSAAVDGLKSVDLALTTTIED